MSDGFLLGFLLMLALADCVLVATFGERVIWATVLAATAGRLGYVIGARANAPDEDLIAEAPAIPGRHPLATMSEDDDE